MCHRPLATTEPLRPGRSPIDLLAILIIAIVLISLVLLRFRTSRESARRMECENQLRQIYLGMESYSLRYGHLPIGTLNPTGPIRSEAVGYHQNWISGLLPMMNREDLYQEIDFDFGVYAIQNADIANQELSEWMCPASAPSLPGNATAYVGVSASTERPIDSSNDGMFVLGRPLSVRDASDGTSYVLAVGEKSQEIGTALPWNSGTRASLRTAGHAINATLPSDPDSRLADSRLADSLFVGGFGSNHGGGANFLLLDGSFRWFAEQTDPLVLAELAGRADQETDPTADPDGR